MSIDFSEHDKFRAEIEELRGLIDDAELMSEDGDFTDFGWIHGVVDRIAKLGRRAHRLRQRDAEMLAKYEQLQGLIASLHGRMTRMHPEAQTNGDSHGVEKGSLSWEEVADRLERLRAQGEPYTSQKRLSERFRCSVATVHKAIHSSNLLEQWAGTETFS